MIILKSILTAAIFVLVLSEFKLLIKPDRMKFIIDYFSNKLNIKPNYSKDIVNKVAKVHYLTNITSIVVFSVALFLTFLNVGMFLQICFTIFAFGLFFYIQNYQKKFLIALIKNSPEVSTCSNPGGCNGLCSVPKKNTAESTPI